MFYFNYVRLCNQRGISPTAAAIEMGFNRSMITRWANGSVPRAATLQRVADYFDVPLSELERPDERADSFYKRLVALCAERNVSPSGVAKAIGLSNAAASGWKQGKIPSAVTLEKLSKYLGVSVAFLTGEENKEKPADDGELSAEQQRAIDMIKNMSPEELARKMAALRAVLEME